MLGYCMSPPLSCSKVSSQLAHSKPPLTKALSPLKDNSSTSYSYLATMDNRMHKEEGLEKDNTYLECKI